MAKTSLARRYLGKGFQHQYIQTIGVDFYVKETKINYKGFDLSIIWSIWDLAGQPHWKEVRKSFYQGAHGSLIVFDATNRNSLANINEWVHEFITYAGKWPMILVGNKIDLRGTCSESVSTEEGKAFAEALSKSVGVPVDYIETSALTGENVDRAFELLAVKNI